MSKKIGYILILLSVFFSLSCSTGIEGTKTIKMTSQDRKALEPTPEETLVAGLRSRQLGDWLPGKLFYVTDDKALYILKLDRGVVQDHHLAGKMLRYLRTEEHPTPDGKSSAILYFSDALQNISMEEGNIYSYDTSKTIGDATFEVTGLDIPMLVDLDIVAAADSLLSGKKVWTKNQLRYDDDAEAFSGKKFVPVAISKVTAGNMVFPLKLQITDENGKTFYLYMNVESRKSGTDSRLFDSLFTLSDPRLRYSDISDEVWESIQAGSVRKGMTKEECKLALGNPPDVDSGHNWDSTIDIWRYRDGTFLRFEDGLLIDFRH